MLCTHSVTAAASTERVIMLADGIVAETGPFDELVAKRGAFFELAKSHLGDAGKPPCADTAAAAPGAHAAPADPAWTPAQEVERVVEHSSTGSLAVDETASELDATIYVAAASTPVLNKPPTP
jgi:hypothetical protein